VQELDLALGGCPEALHRGIVICITGGPEARREPPVAQTVGEFQTRILRALVAVMDEFTIGSAPRERHHERRDHQIGRLSFSHRPTDEGLVEEVADAGEEEFAVKAVELRDVRDPALVGRVALKSRSSRSGA